MKGRESSHLTEPTTHFYRRGRKNLEKMFALSMSRPKSRGKKGKIFFCTVVFLVGFKIGAFKVLRLPSYVPRTRILVFLDSILIMDRYEEEIKGKPFLALYLSVLCLFFSPGNLPFSHTAM